MIIRALLIARAKFLLSLIQKYSFVLSLSFQLPVLRTIEDSVVDEAGSTVTVTEADLVREAVSAPVKTQKKLNIPIAPVREEPDYEVRTKGGYVPPVAYIRHVKRSEEQALDMLEYVLEHKDQVWLSKRGHGPSLLDCDKLERALDLLEKATGMGSPITQVQNMW